MVKLARDNRKIYPDLIYVWTWRPDEYWGWTKYQYATESKYRTEKLLYKKHICGLGVFSRYHSRRTITLLLGVDANLYIHTIKGKNLILYDVYDARHCFGAERIAGRVAWVGDRSEERRVGKECRSRWSPYH